LRGLSTVLLIALKEVAELGVVLALLLLDRHNVLQRLLELRQVQVQVLLIRCKLVYILSVDGYVAFLEVLLDGQGRAISRQDFCELGPVLLLHDLTEVALGTQEDLQFLRLSQVPQ